jgi:hypothetical protein
MKYFKRQFSIFMVALMVVSLFNIVPISADDNTGGTYVYAKVTTEPDDWSGDYLIVYEDGNKAFNGGSSSLNSAGNFIDVTISNGEIEANATTNAAKVTIAKIDGGYSIEIANDAYIGGSSGVNTLISRADAIVNTISLVDGYAHIVSDTSVLRFNSGWAGFRYYKSSGYGNQQVVQLYKLTAGSAPATHTVTVDGTEVETVDDGDVFTVPANVVGYYTDGKLYAPGTEYTVNDDVDFTSVNLAIANAASVKYAIPAALRFKATIQAPADVISAVVESEGMLIAPDDYYSEAGSLDLNSTYKNINIVNSGWYNNTVGTYCASVAGIKETNYDRDFVARAYATVTYADETTTTVYSGISSAKSVSGVAALIKASDAYAGLSDNQKSIIDAFVQ